MVVNQFPSSIRDPLCEQFIYTISDKTIGQPPCLSYNLRVLWNTLNNVCLPQGPSFLWLEETNIVFQWSKD